MEPFEEFLAGKLKTVRHNNVVERVAKLGYHGSIYMLDPSALGKLSEERVKQIIAITHGPAPTRVEVLRHVLTSSGYKTEIKVYSSTPLVRRQQAEDLIDISTPVATRRIDPSWSVGLRGDAAYLLLPENVTEKEILEFLGFNPSEHHSDEDEEVEIDLPDNPLNIDFPKVD